MTPFMHEPQRAVETINGQHYIITTFIKDLDDNHKYYWTATDESNTEVASTDNPWGHGTRKHARKNARRTLRSKFGD